MQIELQNFAGGRKRQTREENPVAGKVNRYVKTHEGERLKPSALIKVHTCRIFFPPPLQQSEAITVSLQPAWTTFVKRADLCLAAVLLLLPRRLFL